MAVAVSHAPLHFAGVTLIGATPENAVKLGLTVAFVAVVVIISRLLRWIARLTVHKRAAFWVRQAISVATIAALVLGVASIWFDDPARLAGALALVTAGVAFALQRVITAAAGYLVILRGSTFNVGDRIVMGGVRGDVVSLNIMQTTILEMGQAKGEQGDTPSMWIESRQYTGRVVTVSNAKVFEEPIYNYTKDLPFMWEEMRIPVRFQDDHARAEQILLEAAQRHTADLSEIGREALDELARRYELELPDPAPKVYWRLTDNWLEMTVRFFVRTHGTRERKDAMSREILKRFTEEGLQIASSTFEIVGVPKLVFETAGPAKG